MRVAVGYSLFGARVRCLASLVFVVAFCLSGCGVLTQVVVGWDTRDVQTTKKTVQVQVSSDVPGARITRRGALGQEVDLGLAPLEDTLEITEETVSTSPLYWPMFVAAGVELIAGIVIVAVESADTAPSDGATSLSSSSSSDSSLTVPFGVFLLGYGMAGDLVTGIFYAAMGDDFKSTRSPGNGDLAVYRAVADGFPEKRAEVRALDRSDLHFAFNPTGAVVASSGAGAPLGPQPGSPTTPPTPGRAAAFGVNGEKASWVVAVMDVQDVNAEQRELAIDRQLVRNLGDQLQIFLAQQGAKTVDRTAQEKTRKEQLRALKADSYQSCYDDSCQIELGKALAASHLVRSKITRFGSQCVLNAELIDLKAEVTCAAASARGTCAAEGFLEMSEQIAQNLFAE